MSAQNHCNLINREAEADVLPAVAAYGLGFIAYLPLASGFLTGKYRPDRTPSGAPLDSRPAAPRILTPVNFDRLERLEAHARERGRSMGELADNAAAGWRLASSEIDEVASL
jgi:aryl-alcohol dehydrogenase-like predicted oxidoreductase